MGKEMNCVWFASVGVFKFVAYCDMADEVYRFLRNKRDSLTVNIDRNLVYEWFTKPKTNITYYYVDRRTIENRYFIWNSVKEYQWSNTSNLDGKPVITGRMKRAPYDIPFLDFVKAQVMVPREDDPTKPSIMIPKSEFNEEIVFDNNTHLWHCIDRLANIALAS